MRAAVDDLIDGLALGARNMIGIAVATATAGIVVGTITLTGLGLMMTEFVEFISGGNVILMLVLIAAISLVLGMGIPTTANYILVATLMAPVVVDLGAQAGLAIPLIAVHLFVFYFGIMADITPPVGLAAFAAAAISREDPIATGFQGALYSLRTAILPFVFIFNPAMLLIGVETWLETIWVAAISLAAILLFSAATMNWFVTKSRLWETAFLLMCCFTLFRPDWWLDRFYPPTSRCRRRELLTRVQQAPADQRLTMVVEGINLEGENVRKTVSIPLGDPQEPRLRLRAVGSRRCPAGEKVTITTSRSAPTPSASGSKAATRSCQCSNRLSGLRALSRRSLPLLWRRALLACSFRESAKLPLRRCRLRHKKSPASSRAFSVALSVYTAPSATGRPCSRSRSTMIAPTTAPIRPAPSPG